MPPQALQLTFYDAELREQAVHNADAEGVFERGAFFTRPEVVDLILDLSGYQPDDQPGTRLLEPSCGQGDFLISAVRRLLSSVAELARAEAEERLCDAVVAVDVHAGSLRVASARLAEILEAGGFSTAAAERLISGWLHHEDFLLKDDLQTFTHVVGNPPYVRQERVPALLMAAYRSRFQTIFDRADLYVPFFEKSLSHLAPGGRLGFICADRWMKNRYGAKLRRFVAEGFELRYYADMTSTDAFADQVDAYPAITIMERPASAAETGVTGDGARAVETRAIYRPAVTAESLVRARDQLLADEPGPGVELLSGVADGELPWLLQQPGKLRLIRDLEARLPTLEEAGASVRIGVATGADKVYIGDHESLDVEESRKLRLAVTRDISTGSLRWTGKGVVNPFEENGSLADPTRYPRFAQWLKTNEATLRARNVAKRSGARWYRTIDRITPSIAERPKLLIPDIKGVANVVYENDGLYPHHNLYYITSDAWPLKPLGVVLRSRITRMFMQAYSTPMRGGYLRFQAQYLRRLRLPRWDDLSAARRSALEESVNAPAEAQDAAVYASYGLDAKQQRQMELDTLPTA